MSRRAAAADQRQTLDKMPDPMTPADVAAILGVGRGLVYEEIAAGRLRAKRLGGAIRPTYLITKAWYLEWLEKA